MSVTIHEQATPCIGRNLKFRKGEGRGEICDFAGTNFSPSFPRANTLPVPSRHLRCLASCAISPPALSHRCPISPPRQLPHKKPAFTERLFHLLRESGFLSRLSTTSCPSLILRRPGCAKCCVDSFLQDAARHGRACPAGLMPLSIPSPGRLFNSMYQAVSEMIPAQMFCLIRKLSVLSSLCSFQLLC